MYIPDLVALERAAAESAKKMLSELTEIARQFGEVDDTLMRRLHES